MQLGLILKNAVNHHMKFGSFLNQVL